MDGASVRELVRGRIRIVGAVRRFTHDGLMLDDGNFVACDTVVAAIGFTPGLEPLVGELGVLDEHGLPRSANPASGLFFNGYRFNLSAGLPFFKTEARRIARAASKV